MHTFLPKFELAYVKRISQTMNLVPKSRYWHSFDPGARFHDEDYYNLG